MHLQCAVSNVQCHFPECYCNMQCLVSTVQYSAAAFDKFVTVCSVSITFIYSFSIKVSRLIHRLIKLGSFWYQVLELSDVSYISKLPLGQLEPQNFLCSKFRCLSPPIWACLVYLSTLQLWLRKTHF